jgi:Fe-Mn family superoxide dismutase
MITFNLDPLPYSYDALEPHIDKQTMEIHHGKHHQAYVTNLNNAMANVEGNVSGIDEIIKNISKYPMAVRNNGGGHFNHSMFWNIMGPDGGGKPSGALADAINAGFSDFNQFKAKIANAGMTRFGSGWAWLIVKDGKLEVCSTPNQDNPLMDIAEVKGTPVLGVDVWEHAYYLKYQNRRADYLEAFWNVVNWKEVEKRFAAASK